MVIKYKLLHLNNRERIRPREKSVVSPGSLELQPAYCHTDRVRSKGVRFKKKKKTSKQATKQTQIQKDCKP